MNKKAAIFSGVALCFPLLFLAWPALQKAFHQHGVPVNESVKVNLHAGAAALVVQLPRSSDLPSPWKQVDLGKAAVPGQTHFDGKVFEIEANGNSPDSTADKVHFTYVTMDAEGEITIRLLPPPGSQLFTMGLMMRESLSSKSPQASLVIFPGKTVPANAPAWELVQLTRGSTGEKVKIKNRSGPLSEPLVSEGKLTGNIWLRLQRKFNSFYAFSSSDGKSWTSLGSGFVDMKKSFFAGIAVSSHSPKTTVKVRVDLVTVPGWSSIE